MSHKGWIWLCAALLAAGCVARADAQQKLPRIDGRKVLAIIARRDFRDEELREPQQVIERQGGQVVIASSTLRTVRGVLGANATPTVLLKDVNPLEYDAIVFVGGPGASEYWENPVAHRIAAQAAGAGKVVSAICIAPVTLANAGLLDGKKATVWSSERRTIEAKGAVYTGAGVQTDGDVITADGPKSAEEFGAAIVRALAKAARVKPGP